MRMHSALALARCGSHGLYYKCNAMAKLALRSNISGVCNRIRLGWMRIGLLQNKLKPPYTALMNCMHTYKKIPLNFVYSYIGKKRGRPLFAPSLALIFFYELDCLFDCPFDICSGSGASAYDLPILEKQEC